VERELVSRSHRMEDVNEGVRIFLCGLAKKVLLANNAGAMWEQLRDIPAAQQTVLGAWLGIAFYTFQIYFDFSGYSDMAIGLGRMLGFRFPRNFNYPLIARTVSDYWRRWHMTLTSWFREYVYIPLCGNRRGKGRTYLNMLTVWILTGLWHGANWNFLLWGLFFFAILAMERAFLGKWLERAPRAIGHVYTLLIVLFSFFIFVFDGSSPALTGDAAMQYLSTMFGASGAALANGVLGYDMLRNLVFVAILCFASTPLPKRCMDALCRRSRVWEWARIALCLAALLLCTAYLVDSSYNPLLYFRF
jgi:alginate O-acetyltransferase complex protein AlgI